MSLFPLPHSLEQFDPPTWAKFQPYYAELQSRPLSLANGRQWLNDWSHLLRLIWEGFNKIYIAKTLDTTDTAAEAAFLDFIHNVMPKMQVAEQALRERLLALNLPDADIALTLRQMRTESELFRAENISLITKVEELTNEYEKLTGGLKADWDGEEKNLSQLEALLQEKDRAVRERAYRTMMALWLNVREQLNEIYSQLLSLRNQIATQADLPDYRAYAFLEKGRFEYSPEDCFTFHAAIEAVVVPAAARIMARRRQKLGLERLRPWDLNVELRDQPPLKPYNGQAELIEGAQRVFQQVDPALGSHFRTMVEEKLLDLDTRPGKGLGGYCTELPLRQRPFIFMNGVGRHDDVQTLLHEGGHAFHVFETAALPLLWQTHAPMEFCEVASMAMELLAAPYLTRDQGGFYSPAEAARARIEHLEGILLFLPYMAVVDAFQHWVYTNPETAASAAQCDAKWDELWARFMPELDWDGLEEVRLTGWHRKPHIFESPFYYIEYGLAQVGALQVWRNSQQNQAAAVAAYRQALRRGDTLTLPDLFAAAGVEFRFDSAMLAELTKLIETTLTELANED
jgi:oligoendopeptidase F